MKKLALVVVVVAAFAMIARAPEPTPTMSPTPVVATVVQPRARIAVPVAPVLEVAGKHFESAALADRETSLVASNRRAWRLAELDAAFRGPMHVHTADGDFDISSDDAMLVRRDDGTLYIGWLASGTGALADRERPAERIENPLAITPVVHAAELPAEVTMIVGGKRVRTLTPKTFAAAATVTFKGKRDVTHAIALAHLVSFESDGTVTTAQPPAPGAHAVVYMNRRERFKLAWLDAKNAPIGAPQREVTQVTLAQ